MARMLTSSRQPLRQLLSREERRRQRAAEEAAGSTAAIFSAKRTTSTVWGWLSVGIGTGAISAGAWTLLADPKEYEIARKAQESTVGACAPVFF